MIYYKTTMKEMPKSCQECSMMDCSLPVCARRYGPQIIKTYRTKRHPQCPLVELKENN